MYYTTQSSYKFYLLHRRLLGIGEGFYVMVIKVCDGLHFLRAFICGDPHRHFLFDCLSLQFTTIHFALGHFCPYSMLITEYITSFDYYGRSRGMDIFLDVGALWGRPVCCVGVCSSHSKCQNCSIISEILLQKLHITHEPLMLSFLTTSFLLTPSYRNEVHIWQIFFLKLHFLKILQAA